MKENNKIERWLRGIAGAFIIIAIILFKYHHPVWIWFILFIGINLLQSSFTNWCPMITMLKRIFNKDAKYCCEKKDC